MMTEPTTCRRRDILFGAAIIASVFVALTIKSWRRWPDLIVDFGAQLYMPWQLSTGAVLYRDVAYLPGGPLSQYYHALLFKIFGVSFLTLVVSNLVVLAMLLAVIYLCFYRCSDQLTAITASVAVLVVFAFAHFTTKGIFNYITPYSAEVVHGLVLSVFAVALLARWIETENEWLAGLAGVCGGLVLLTKPDLFLALLLTLGAAAALFWRARRRTKPLLRPLALMAGGASIPPVGFFFWFFRLEDFQQSAGSVLAAWIPLLTTSAAENPLYRWCLGLDRPWVHLQEILLHSLGLAGIATACVLPCWRRIPLWLACILAAGLAVLVLVISSGYNWFDSGRCLPLVCLVVLPLLIWRGAREGWEPSVVFPVLWAFWSLAVLAKLGFYCRIWHYGFALAMPAFVSGIYLLLWALPRQLERGGFRPFFFRALLWLMFLPGFTQLAGTFQKVYADKTMPIGSGADTILTFNPRFRPVEADVAAALRWIETSTPPRATLAVLPQGVILNYLSRHINPCSYLAWNPPEMAAFGQEKMTADFIKSSPDYVIELRVDYGEYREAYFGQEKRFGRDAQQWIDSHYQLVQRIGHDWLKDDQFGIKILKKNHS